MNRHVKGFELSVGNIVYLGPDRSELAEVVRIYINSGTGYDKGGSRVLLKPLGDSTYLLYDQADVNVFKRDNPEIPAEEILGNFCLSSKCIFFLKES
jgi:hypothetical protein